MQHLHGYIAYRYTRGGNISFLLKSKRILIGTSESANVSAKDIARKAIASYDWCNDPKSSAPYINYEKIISVTTTYNSAYLGMDTVDFCLINMTNIENKSPFLEHFHKHINPFASFCENKLDFLAEEEYSKFYGYGDSLYDYQLDVFLMQRSTAYLTSLTFAPFSSWNSIFKGEFAMHSFSGQIAKFPYSLAFNDDTSYDIWRKITTMLDLGCFSDLKKFLKRQLDQMEKSNYEVRIPAIDSDDSDRDSVPEDWHSIPDTWHDWKYSDAKTKYQIQCHSSKELDLAFYFKEIYTMFITRPFDSNKKTLPLDSVTPAFESAIKDYMDTCDGCEHSTELKSVEEYPLPDWWYNNAETDD
jgi:hypothetical protein